MTSIWRHKQTRQLRGTCRMQGDETQPSPLPTHCSCNNGECMTGVTDIQH